MVNDHDDIVHGIINIVWLTHAWMIKHMGEVLYMTWSHTNTVSIIVCWLYAKQHALRGAFFASFCSVHWMIVATWLILSYFHKNHLETTDYSNMKRIRALHWQKNISNQLEISCLPRQQLNTAVKANYVFSTSSLSNVLDSHCFFLWLSCLQQWQPVAKAILYLPAPFTKSSTPGLANMAVQCSAWSSHSKFQERKWCTIYIGTGQWAVIATPAIESYRRSKKQQWSEWALWLQQMKGANIEIVTTNPKIWVTCLYWYQMQSWLQLWNITNLWWIR